MKLLWTADGWGDYIFRQDTDGKSVERINELIKDARRSPFKGIGKPEPLRGDLSGWWSRRITGDHRLVYRVSGRVTHSSSKSLHAGITTETKGAAPRHDVWVSQGATSHPPGSFRAPALHRKITGKPVSSSPIENHLEQLRCNCLPASDRCC